MALFLMADQTSSYFRSPETSHNSIPTFTILAPRLTCLSNSNIRQPTVGLQGASAGFSAFGIASDMKFEIAVLPLLEGPTTRTFTSTDIFEWLCRAGPVRADRVSRLLPADELRITKYSGNHPNGHGTLKSNFFIPDTQHRPTRIPQTGLELLSVFTSSEKELALSQ